MTGSPGRWLSLLMLATLAGGCGGGGGGATAPTSPTSPTPTQISGSIAGTATASGDGVANATVTLAGGGTQSTNAQGQFTFSSVPAGTQTLSIATPSGFDLASGETQTKNVTVNAGQTATVSWSLRQVTTPPSRGVTIQMQATTFVAPDVTIARGDTVTWVNALAVPHTITPSNASQPGAWPSQNVPAEQGVTFQHTFTQTGTYPYDCLVHAGMTGVVRVQ